MKRIILSVGLAAPIWVLAHHGWERIRLVHVLKLSGQDRRIGLRASSTAIFAPGDARKTWLVVLGAASRMDVRACRARLPKPGPAAERARATPTAAQAGGMRAERVTLGGQDRRAEK